MSATVLPFRRPEPMASPLVDFDRGGGIASGLLMPPGGPPAAWSLSIDPDGSMHAPRRAEVVDLGDLGELASFLLVEACLDSRPGLLDSPDGAELEAHGLVERNSVLGRRYLNSKGLRKAVRIIDQTEEPHVQAWRLAANLAGPEPSRWVHTALKGEVSAGEGRFVRASWQGLRSGAEIAVEINDVHYLRSGRRVALVSMWLVDGGRFHALLSWEGRMLVGTNAWRDRRDPAPALQGPPRTSAPADLYLRLTPPGPPAPEVTPAVEPPAPADDAPAEVVADPVHDQPVLAVTRIPAEAVLACLRCGWTLAEIEQAFNLPAEGVRVARWWAVRRWRPQEEPGTKVVSRADVMSGQPYIGPSRVPASAVIDNLADGWTPEQVVDMFPTIDEHGVAAAVWWACAAEERLP